MNPTETLGFLAVYNIVQNTLLRERGYVAGNLVATGIGLAWSRRSGLSADAIGLSGENVPRGLRLGTGVMAAATGFALLARDRNEVLGMLEDPDLARLSDGQVWFRLLVRFPLGTALFEEVWFRGVLPAVARKHGSPRPDLSASTAFAAWHLIPTASAIAANPAGRSLPPGRRALLVIGGSFAAGVGGAALAGMRRCSGSLAAPWLAHAAINGLTFWLAVKHRRTR